MGFFTKLQWKHLSVVEQMLDVTEMHLPKNVKTLRVASWGSGNDGTRGMEHVLCHLSVKSQRVIAHLPLPTPTIHNCVAHTFQKQTVFAQIYQVVERVKAEQLKINEKIRKK